jgi:serine/threonine-protein kinase RsbW
VAYAVNLAVEEVCVNVVNHAYAGGPPGPIELEFRLAREPAPARLSIVVRDRAPFFDPDQAPPPDLDADIDDRRIGGLGWFLVRETMDAVSHAARPDGGNVVTMVKSLADAAAGDAQ